MRLKHISQHFIVKPLAPFFESLGFCRRDADRPRFYLLQSVYHRHRPTPYFSHSPVDADEAAPVDRLPDEDQRALHRDAVPVTPRRRVRRVGRILRVVKARLANGGVVLEYVAARLNFTFAEYSCLDNLKNHSACSR